MERRKFIIGAGALATGSSAAVGTGAFSTATALDRQATVEIDSDDEAQLALVPSDTVEGIEIDNDGLLNIDLTGPEDQGVNPQSTYTWGNPDNLEDEFAFKILNQTENTYESLTLSYEFEDDSWIEDTGTLSDRRSTIEFQVFRGTEGSNPSDLTAPRYSSSGDSGRNPSEDIMEGSPGVDFTPGDDFYVVVEVNTDEPLADLDDDLSGHLTIEASSRDDI